MKLNVNEIFYSLQGEGARAGEPSIFIRLTKCNMACDFCDTEFNEGKDMDIDQMLEVIRQYPCKWIIWTGGEPTLQLTENHLRKFREKGYHQAIETNGTRPVPALIDYISCSPKKDFKHVKKQIPKVNEIRIPIKKGQNLPDITDLPVACKYFVSPVFDGNKFNHDNVNYCVELVKNNSLWTLSLQLHKLIDIQ